jgi:hypothetical protein
MWVRDFLPAIRDFETFAHGRSSDLKPFGFITLSRKTPSILFVSCMANETLSGSFKVNERRDVLLAGESNFLSLLPSTWQPHLAQPIR